uniref:BTB domain-containing protein n=1 Tax=Pyrodinium bahamense TaxID=73915 RepID=A0A7S0B896_9DINO|mmetsp:Transcript_54416/g.150951  ORF Transcript_54416/g.150951 Transcript_54416/m.150951 type:complete len:600 (+) Transcript_54416:36-1835(+)
MAENAAESLLGQSVGSELFAVSSSAGAFMHSGGAGPPVLNGNGGLFGQGAGLFGQSAGVGFFGQPIAGGLFGQSVGGGLFVNHNVSGGFFDQSGGTSLFDQSGSLLFESNAGASLFGQSSGSSHTSQSTSTGTSSEFSQKQLELMAHLLQNQDLADVVVLVGPAEVRFPAVRALLANMSEPFRAMLYGPFLEGQGVARLPEVSCNAFRCIQRAAYCLDPQVSAESCAETIVACELYDIKSLAVECQRFLKHCITPKDILKAYSECIARKVELMPDVEEHIWKMILLHPQQVLQSPGFEDTHPDIIMKLVKLDEFSVDEALLWSSLLKWAKAAVARTGLPKADCTLQVSLTSGLSAEEHEMLRLVIPHMRFPCMEKAFFVDQVAHLLERDKVESVLVHHLLGRPSEFCEKARSGKPLDSLVAFEVTDASHDLQQASALSKGEGQWELKGQRLTNNALFSLTTFGTLTMQLKGHIVDPEVSLSKLEIETEFIYNRNDDSSQNVSFEVFGSSLWAYCNESKIYKQIMTLKVGHGRSCHAADLQLPSTKWKLHLGPVLCSIDGTTLSGKIRIKRVALYSGFIPDAWVADVVSKNQLVKRNDET